MPIKTRVLRELGRALVMGTAQDLTDALDAVIEPKGAMWERVSDLAIAWIVEPLIAGRAEVVAGIRDALEQVDG